MAATQKYLHIRCATTLCQTLVTFIVTTATVNEDKTFAAKLVFELLDIFFNFNLVTFSVFVASNFRILDTGCGLGKASERMSRSIA